MERRRRTDPPRTPEPAPKPELDEFVHRARGLSSRARLDDAAVEVIEALEAAGVEAVLLKGPALSTHLYRPDEQRNYSDIDLLVDPEDLDDAREALATLGFADVATDWFNRFLAASDPEMLHAELWTRTRGLDPVLVDLHWRLDGCDAPAQAAWRHLTTQRGSIELLGRSVPVLAPEGLALHLAIHAAQHGPAHVRAIADLERGVERWPPDTWREAAELAEKVGGAQAFAAGIRLIPAGAALADELGLPAGGAVAWEIEHRDARPRGAFHLEALKRAPGIRGSLSVLRRALIPPREWIEWQHPWSARGRLRLLLGYGAHLSRTPLWAIRAWRFRRREVRAGS